MVESLLRVAGDGKDGVDEPQLWPRELQRGIVRVEGHQANRLQIPRELQPLEIDIVLHGLGDDQVPMLRLLARCHHHHIPVQVTRRHRIPFNGQRVAVRVFAVRGDAGRVLALVLERMAFTSAGPRNDCTGAHWFTRGRNRSYTSFHNQTELFLKRPQSEKHLVTFLMAYSMLFMVTKNQ